MFWGQVISAAENKVRMDLKMIIHLSNVCLDLSSFPEGEQSPTLVYIICQEKRFLLAALTPSQPTASVNMELDPLQDISFQVTGPATVHMTGYDVVEDGETVSESTASESTAFTGEVSDGSSTGSSTKSRTNAMQGISVNKGVGLPPPTFN